MREVIVVLLVGAVGYYTPLPMVWIESRCNLLVVTQRDGGAGSLRAAIVGAARCNGHAQIDVLVPVVYLDAPLPKLHNRWGVKLTGKAAGSRIVGATVIQPLFSISSPTVIVQSVAISGEGPTGVLAFAGTLSLFKTSVTGFQDGVVTARAGARVSLNQTIIDDNDHAVLAAYPPESIRLVQSRISRSRKAGLNLGYGPDTRVTIARSEFVDNRIDLQGTVQTATISGSILRRSGEASVVLRANQLALLTTSVVGSAGPAIIANGPSDIVIHESRLETTGLAIHAPERRSLKISHSDLTDALVSS